MIATLAKLLGLSPEHAEASMHSERAARAVLTRRNLFAAGAALAAGSVFSFPQPASFTYVDWGRAGDWVQIVIGGWRSPGVCNLSPRCLGEVPSGALGIMTRVVLRAEDLR